MTAKIFALANQKGGVGKTTTAINLATALAVCGKKTLLVDLDSQGNASTGVGVQDRQDIIGTYDLLLHTEYYDDAAIETEIDNFSIIPASLDVATSEVALSNLPDPEQNLKKSLLPYLHKYDYIFLDCPPNLGITTLNALVAADYVLVPLQAEFYALEGLTQILGTVRRVRDNINPDLRLGGVLITMYDRRNKLCLNVDKDVRNHLGSVVFKTLIPRNVRVAEAPSYGTPVLFYDHTCIGAQAYAELAIEFGQKF